MKNLTAVLLLAAVAGSLSAQSGTVKPGASTQHTIIVDVRCKDGEKKASDNSWYEDFSGNWVFPKTPPYICKSGKWVEDTEQEAKDVADVKRIEAQAEQAELEKKLEKKRRTELWNALRTRILTDAEMEEILAKGVEIVPHQAAYMTPNQYGTLDVYYPTQNDIQAAQLLLIEALYYQSKMRLDAEKICSK